MDLSLARLGTLLVLLAAMLVFFGFFTFVFFDFEESSRRKMRFQVKASSVKQEARRYERVRR